MEVPKYWLQGNHSKKVLLRVVETKEMIKKSPERYVTTTSTRDGRAENNSTFKCEHK